ncbi:MAG: 2-phosphosulfolactate phosphatase [Ignavibacteriae bacterium]|nr:2-phosphosulfolactate phosphatase [Ignavibacteriota bacterium]
MRVELFFTPHHIDELYLREKTVVVIDVLRASTTIARALSNGAKEIIPVTTVESAMKIVGNLSGDVTLLGGERNGKMIEGFHLGNSPLEYTEDRVKGKSIVFSSTNGSQALAKARHAKELVVCGFVNMSAVAEFLLATGSDVTILCSGRAGNFSIEDTVCAGMLITKLSEASGKVIECGDAGSAAMTLYKNAAKSIVKMLARSQHGQYLKEIGFVDDLRVCAEVDSVPVLPQLVGNVVKLKTAEKVSVVS